MAYPNDASWWSRRERKINIHPTFMLFSHRTTFFFFGKNVKVVHRNIFRPAKCSHLPPISFRVGNLRAKLKGEMRIEKFMNLFWLCSDFSAVRNLHDLRGKRLREAADSSLLFFYYYFRVQFMCLLHLLMGFYDVRNLSRKTNSLCAGEYLWRGCLKVHEKREIVINNQTEKFLLYLFSLGCVWSRKSISQNFNFHEMFPLNFHGIFSPPSPWWWTAFSLGFRRFSGRNKKKFDK